MLDPKLKKQMQEMECEELLDFLESIGGMEIFRGFLIRENKIDEYKFVFGEESLH